MKDLDIDTNGGAGIGLGINLFIGNNTISFNTSAFSADYSINSSVNLTLWGLDLKNLTSIMKVDNFTTNDDDIINSGTNCNGTSCQIISYSDGVLLFNSTGFSSFAANGTSNNLPSILTLILNTTNISLNDTTVNLTVYNTTSDVDGDSVKVIYNWLVNGSSKMVFNVPFEGINGTNVNNTHDYSGNGFHGVITNQDENATWNFTGGHDGKGAYQFDGGNDVIEFPGQGPDMGSQNFSVSAWIKFNETLDTGADSYLMFDSVGWKFYLSGSSTFNGTYFRLNNGINNTDIAPTIDYSLTLKNGNWHNLVTTVNKQGNATIYLNGTKIASKSVIHVGTLSSNVYLFVGKDFNGSIDDVSVWNGSLSNKQVWNLYSGNLDQITSQELSNQQNWTVDATPNDGTNDGVTVRSNQVIILGTDVEEESPSTTTPTTVSGGRRRIDVESIIEEAEEELRL